MAAYPGRVRSRPAAVPWGREVDSRAAFSLPQDIPALSPGLLSRPVVWREGAFLLWRKGLPGAGTGPVGGWRKHARARASCAGRPWAWEGRYDDRRGGQGIACHFILLLWVFPPPPFPLPFSPSLPLPLLPPSLCLRERHAPPVLCLFSPVPRIVVGTWTALAAVGTRAALATVGTRTALTLHISLGLLDEHAA